MANLPSPSCSSAVDVPSPMCSRPDTSMAPCSQTGINHSFNSILSPFGTIDFFSLVGGGGGGGGGSERKLQQLQQNQCESVNCKRAYAIRAMCSRRDVPMVRCFRKVSARRPYVNLQWTDLHQICWKYGSCLQHYPSETRRKYIKPNTVGIAPAGCYSRDISAIYE